MEEKIVTIEVISVDNKCADIGRPGCLETPDERYTMRFDDIGEAPIQFCAFCGPKSLELQAALERAFAICGPEFTQRFKDAVHAAEEESERKRS